MGTTGGGANINHRQHPHNPRQVLRPCPSAVHTVLMYRSLLFQSSFAFAVSLAVVTKYRYSTWSWWILKGVSFAWLNWLTTDPELGYGVMLNVLDSSTDEAKGCRLNFELKTFGLSVLSPSVLSLHSWSNSNICVLILLEEMHPKREMRKSSQHASYSGSPIATLSRPAWFFILSTTRLRTFRWFLSRKHNVDEFCKDINYFHIDSLEPILSIDSYQLAYICSVSLGSMSY